MHISHYRSFSNYRKCIKNNAAKNKGVSVAYAKIATEKWNNKI